MDGEAERRNGRGSPGGEMEGREYRLNGRSVLNHFGPALSLLGCGLIANISTPCFCHVRFALFLPHISYSRSFMYGFWGCNPKLQCASSVCVTKISEFGFVHLEQVDLHQKLL